MVSSVRRNVRTKRTLSNEVLRHLFIEGAVTITLSSLYAVGGILKEISKELKKKISNRSLKNTFDYLRRRGYLTVKSRKWKIHFDLSWEGRKIAGQYIAFRSEPISRPSMWDGKWRIVLFDIPTDRKVVRDALRFMLKRFGFCQLQKSVWIFPFDCKKEIEDLKSFFDLSNSAVRFIVFSDSGDMREFRQYFKI